MKKVLIALASLFAALVWGCTADLDKVNDRLDDLEKRVEILEDLCEQMNTNIVALQTIVSALQNNDYVTSVSPIVQGGDTIGYVIIFSKSGPVTIYNGTDGQDGTDGEDGTDGQDGYAPQIGVRQDTDGVYYWTLDGEWLLDDNGEKVPAQGRDGSDGEDGSDGSDGEDGTDGTDGQNGVTPQLKIEDDYWWVSYDGGLNWTKLGKAVGEDGKDGADGVSIFEDVYEQDGNVYFVLSSGETIVIPMYAALDILFTYEPGAVCMDGETLRIPYEVIGADEWTDVVCVGSNGWDAFIDAEDSSTGYVEVTNNATDKSGTVLVFACNAAGNTVTKALVFYGGVLTLDTYGVFLNGSAEVVDVELTTNTDYQVLIPDDARSWISVVEGTKSGLRTETVQLAVAEYPDGPDRQATVRFVVEGRQVQTLHIYQMSDNYNSPAPDFSKSFMRRSLFLQFSGNWEGYSPAMNAARDTALRRSSGRIVPMAMYSGSGSITYPEISAYEEMFSLRGYPTGYVNYYSEVVNYSNPQKTTDMILGLSDEAKEKLPANTGLAGYIFKIDSQLELYLQIASRCAGEYYLNIFVLEDGIVGPQSDYFGLVEDTEKYVHNYVVRGQMTEAYGEPITLTDNGILDVHRLYTLPDNVENVYNVHVVAYLTYRGQYSGAVTGAGYIDVGYIVDNVVDIRVNSKVPFIYEDE